jgi:hypothetical protein
VAQSNSQITYTSRSDATAEAEVNALANVYRLIIESAKKRGRFLDKSGPEDVKGRSDNDFHASSNSTR